MKPITRFRGEFRWLSNFYPATIEVEVNGSRVVAKSVEHAYQASKTGVVAREKQILRADTASEAARLGRDKRKTVLHHDWYDIKGDVMRPLVFAKFEQHPELMAKLLATGDRYLMEGNYWHDNYFGVCCCKRCHDSGEQGSNLLGRILMEIREKHQPVLKGELSGFDEEDLL